MSLAFIGDIHATINAYRAESSFSGEEFYFWQLPYSKIFREVFCRSDSLTENKYQGTLVYQMKNETAHLNRIVFNLIRNNMCALAWKYGVWKK
jgi:hypothetical protein